MVADDMELESVAQAIDEAGFNVGATRIRQAMREIDALRREAGFARLAYDQLIARQEQDKERLIELVAALRETIDGIDYERWAGADLDHTDMLIRHRALLAKLDAQS